MKASSKKPAPAANGQVSISSFFKPKSSGGEGPAQSVTPNSKKKGLTPEFKEKDVAARADDMEVEQPQGSPAAVAAAASRAPKRPHSEEQEAVPTKIYAKKSTAAKAAADVEVSDDDDVPTRRTRQRVRVSLRESSSEEDDDDDAACAAMHGRKAAPQASTQSGEPTPVRSATKAKREELPEIPKPKSPIDTAGKGRISAGASKHNTAKKELKDDVMEVVDEEQHERFAAKVGLFQKNHMAAAADTGPSQSKDPNSEYGGILQPCMLTFPRGAKLTPFEAQVVEIKTKHPDKVLLIECGYKYKFLGRDAEIAAKVLNIFHHIDHNFLVASIPTFRLQVHTRRLVEAGYKVGVVRQMETAALKAAGADRNKQFKRELCEVYTKSTMLVEDVDVLGEHTHVTSSGGNAVYMMCICEEPASSSASSGGDTKVHIGMVCIDTASGDIVYDDWEDGELRQHLACRVAHLQPRELLLPENLSSTSSKVLKRLVAPLALSQACAVRVEVMKAHHFKADHAESKIRKFFDQHAGKSMGGEDADTELESSAEFGCVREGTIGELGGDAVTRLARPVICCLGGLLHYLSEFKLDRVLGLTSNFWRFSSPSHMMLDATTLINLEVLANQDDQTEEGSLFWLLKQTKTAFGARLLRHWVTHPLLDKARIAARHDAVEELIEDPVAIEALAKHLKGLPDLERALARLHYSKCSPNELVAVLRAFVKIGQVSKEAKQQADSLRSELLGWLVRGMPEASSKLEAFLEELDLKAALATHNGKATPDTRNLLKGYTIKSQYPTIYAIKKDVSEVERLLDEHLVSCRHLLGIRDLEYKSVLTTSYLLEVPNDKQGKVPKSWLKINGTQKASRYHSPEIQELQEERMRLHERLDAEIKVAWQQFQSRVAECYGELHAVVQRLAVLDCLLSLADVARKGGWCRPQLYDEHQLRIVAGKHPMVDALMTGSYVPNDVELSHTAQVAMVITGPNMGGKSSYMRQTALLVIMAQVGSFVPADEMHMGVFDGVWTRMGAEDFIAQGRSTFMVELQEAADILVRATSRSLIIMDELGRGTSTHDGTAIAYATLKSLVQDIRAFTLFVTHYQLICQLETELPTQVGNYHMGYVEEGDSRIAFMYRLVKGSAKRSFGLNVALLAKLPQEIVDRAACMSKRLEGQVQKKIGECVEELAVKVLQQVGGDEAKQVGGEEEVAHNITCLLALKESAKQLLSARTLL